MTETRNQEKERRQKQHKETAKMDQEDKESYLREFLSNYEPLKKKQQEKQIEKFIHSYPQFKQQVGENLIREVVRGNINEKEFEEIKNKLDLLEKKSTIHKEI